MLCVEIYCVTMKNVYWSHARNVTLENIRNLTSSLFFFFFSLHNCTIHILHPGAAHARTSYTISSTHHQLDLERNSQTVIANIKNSPGLSFAFLRRSCGIGELPTTAITVKSPKTLQLFSIILAFGPRL